MSVHATSQGTSTGAGYETYGDAERGYGWVAFAGVLLLVLGTINTIEGIAAIGNAHFFVHNTHYIVGSLNSWGWIVLCIGVIELLVGLGVFAKNQFARWTGVVILSLNAIAQLLMMPSYPLWSLCIFTLDILAIYGLVAYGRHITD
jgi:predicted Na+-dependent transporter